MRILLLGQGLPRQLRASRRQSLPSLCAPCSYPLRPPCVLRLSPRRSPCALHSCPPVPSVRPATAPRKQPVPPHPCCPPCPLHAYVVGAAVAPLPSGRGRAQTSSASQGTGTLKKPEGWSSLPPARARDTLATPPAHPSPPTQQFSRRPPPPRRNQRASVALLARGLVRAQLRCALPRESMSAAFPPACAGRLRNQKPSRGQGQLPPLPPAAHTALCGAPKVHAGKQAAPGLPEVFWRISSASHARRLAAGAGGGGGGAPLMRPRQGRDPGCITPPPPSAASKPTSLEGSRSPQLRLRRHSTRAGPRSSMRATKQPCLPSG